MHKWAKRIEEEAVFARYNNAECSTFVGHGSTLVCRAILGVGIESLTIHNARGPAKTEVASRGAGRYRESNIFHPSRL